MSKLPSIERMVEIGHLQPAQVDLEGLRGLLGPSIGRDERRRWGTAPPTLGARALGNRPEHLRNIEGRGTIYLAHSHQEHFMPILNVT